MLNFEYWQWWHSHCIRFRIKRIHTVHLIKLMNSRRHILDADAWHASVLDEESIAVLKQLLLMIYNQR